MSKEPRVGVFFVMDFSFGVDSGIEKHMDKVQAVVQEVTKELEAGQAALMKKYGETTYSVARVACNSGRLGSMLSRQNISPPMLSMLQKHHEEMISVPIDVFNLDPDVVCKLAIGINEHQDLMHQQVSERINELLKQESKV